METAHANASWSAAPATALAVGLFYIVLIVVGPDEWLSGLSLTFETYGATSDKGDMMGMRLDFKRAFPAKSHGSNLKRPRPSP